MRQSVAEAWPALATSYEGRCDWLYLDSVGLPTTGLGYRVVDRAAMLALPWLRKDGTPATNAEKSQEWEFVNKRMDLKDRGGFAYRSVATLHLPDSEIDRLLMVTTDRFWTALTKTLPDLEKWPADAQLALLDMAYNLGPGFLGPDWPNFTAAAKAGDFAKCAEHCLRKDKAPRDYRHRNLFNNAALVVRYGTDRDVLWDVVTPPAPPPKPKEPTVSFSKQWNSEYVMFRGGNVPPVVRDVLLAVPSVISLSQGGLSQSVLASANTHAGLGAYDVSVKGQSRSRILTTCAELIRSGEAAFPRGGLFGSAMFATHIHVVSSNVAWSALHPEARAQLDDFRKGMNGLSGGARGRYVGPKVPLGSWKDSPYNPANHRPGGTFQVVSSNLQGLNLERKPKLGTLRKGGYQIVAERQVRRWGRWNLATAKWTLYAVADDKQTYCRPVI